MLLARGYTQAGKWDLAQVCDHLRDWLTFPVDGFPRQPLPVRILLWVLKNTVAPGQFRKMLETGRMPPGTPTMPETVSADGGDPQKALDGFLKAMERFETHQGEYHPSPLFGSVDRQAATRLQLIHIGHHLGFLIPMDGARTV